MQFLSIKTSIPCILYSCCNFYVKKKGGEIFGDHNLPSGDQKFIVDRPLAPVLKLRICSCLACVYRVMDARGKFGEHERCVRVARGDSQVQL